MANSYLDKLYKSFGDLFARSVNGVKPDASGNISLSLPDSYDLPKATDKTLGGVTVGSNISVSDGKISLSKSNVTSALGYTPPAQDTVYTLPNASENTVGGVKIGQNITVSAGTISLTKANVTTALGYVPSSTNATYSVFTGATSSSAGVAGLVPAPSAGKQKMYLRADGSWSEPTNTVYDNATQTVAGLMSASDKAKLDGVANGANKYIHPSYSAQPNKLYKVTVDSQGHISATSEVTKADIVALGIPAQDTAYTLPVATSSALGGVKVGDNITYVDGKISLSKTNVTSALGYTPPQAVTATSSAQGLMSAFDKAKLDGIQANANNYTHPSHTAKSNGFHKVTVESLGHVSGTTAVTKSDITALGIPAQDTTYSNATESVAGLMSASDKKKLDGIEAGSNKYTLPVATATVLGGVKTGANITNKSGEISVSFGDVVNALGWIPLKTVNSHEADANGNVDVSAGFFETDGIKTARIGYETNSKDKYVYVPDGGTWFCFGYITEHEDGTDGDYNISTGHVQAGLYAGGTRFPGISKGNGYWDVNNIICLRNADGEWGDE